MASPQSLTLLLLSSPELSFPLLSQQPPANPQTFGAGSVHGHGLPTKPRVWCPAARRRRSKKTECPRWSPPRTENKPHRVTLPPLEGEQSHPYQISTKNSPATMTPPVQTVQRLPAIDPVPRAKSPAQPAQTPERGLISSSMWSPAGTGKAGTRDRAGEPTSRRAGRSRDRQGAGDRDQPQCFYGGAFPQFPRPRRDAGVSGDFLPKR